jgi:hypothetical protein
MHSQQLPLARRPGLLAIGDLEFVRKNVRRSQSACGFSIPVTEHENHVPRGKSGAVTSAPPESRPARVPARATKCTRSLNIARNKNRGWPIGFGEKQPCERHSATRANTSGTRALSGPVIVGAFAAP